MRALLQHRLVAVEWAQRQKTFPSDVVVKACACLWLWRKFSWLAKVTLVLYGFNMFCPTYEKPRSPGAQALWFCAPRIRPETSAPGAEPLLPIGCGASYEVVPLVARMGGLDTTFWMDILCWQHSTYNFVTHNFVLLLDSPPRPLSFLPSPSRLQHLVLIIQRSCLVGLSGPLISWLD